MQKSIQKLVLELDILLKDIADKKKELEELKKLLPKIEKGTAIKLVGFEDRKIYNTQHAIQKLMEKYHLDRLTEAEIIRMINEKEYMERIFRYLYVFFNSSFEELKNGIVHLDTFLVLSTILENYNFKNHEVFEIIKDAIFRNQLTGISEENNHCIIVDAFKVEKFKFKSVTEEEKKFYLNRNLLLDLKNEEKLDEKGKAFATEILDVLPELQVDNYEETNKSLVTMIEILRDKQDTYTEEDIDILIDSLLSVDLSLKCATIVRQYMESNLAKRREREKKNAMCSKPIYKENIVSTNCIRDKEYKKLIGKLKEYYDVERNLLKKELSYEVMIEIAAIMIKLSYDKKKIYIFLNTALQSLQEEIGIASFVRDYNKYLYYLEENSISEILEYLNEMMITTDEEYVFWKTEAESSIKELSRQLPNKVDYEYQLAKKM